MSRSPADTVRSNWRTLSSTFPGPEQQPSLSSGRSSQHERDKFRLAPASRLFEYSFEMGANGVHRHSRLFGRLLGRAALGEQRRDGSLRWGETVELAKVRSEEHTSELQ